MEEESIVIVGGGLSGLTIAHQLVQNNKKVIVIEKESELGGLARSYSYNGHIFDMGPHRFHTDDQRVLDFIKNILNHSYLSIPRSSGVRMFGSFHSWPLGKEILFKLPPVVMLRVALDLFRKRPPKDDKTFRSTIVRQYGKTLYDIFFKPYTNKFLAHFPAEIHKDWASAGVNRAVIDQHESSNSIMKLLISTLLPKAVNTSFIYPHMGMSEFCENLKNKIVERGGRVITSSQVSAIEQNKKMISSITTDCGKRLPTSRFIWTAPLPQLLPLLKKPDAQLYFLSTIFYNFILKKKPLQRYQWCYYGSEESFSRTSMPETFSPKNTPTSESSLCVELTTYEGHPTWKTPNLMLDKVIKDLVKTKTISSENDIKDVFIEKVSNTYPIYHLDYAQELEATFNDLSEYDNLILAGRSGSYWYNNMDHSIAQALDISDNILKNREMSHLGQSGRKFW
jgi:protoporphyrinogen oxidase